MSRLPLVLAGFLVTVSLLVVAVVASAEPANQGGPTLRLGAGQGDGVVAVNQFFPPEVKVEAGTTITWSIGSDEAHTVTFPAGRPVAEPIIPQPEDATHSLPPMANPDVFFPSSPVGPWDGATYVNSSPIGRGEQFSVTFARPGKYDVVCLFHPAMTGTVEVVAAGTSGITTQSEADQYAATHYQSVHAAQVGQMLATRNIPVKADRPDGSAIWFTRAGTEWRGGHVQIYAFLPDSLTIRQGDTVVWYNDAPVAPHTVTFPAAGGSLPDLIVPTLPDGTVLTPEMMASAPPPSGPPDPSQLPRLLIGPGGLPAMPSAAYDGVSLFNSGVFGDDVPPAGNAWALTFDTPGTYEYICVLHAELPMKGTISVLPS